MLHAFEELKRILKQFDLFKKKKKNKTNNRIAFTIFFECYVEGNNRES